MQKIWDKVVAEICLQHPNTYRNVEDVRTQFNREIGIVADSNSILLRSNDEFPFALKGLKLRLNLVQVRLLEIVMVRKMEHLLLEWERPEMIDKRTRIGHSCQ